MGFNSGGTVTNCYTTGRITGIVSVGGLVASNYGSITTSYSTAMISGSGGYYGGLVASNYGSVATSYSTGTVTGEHNVGGLVGRNEGMLANCYSTGAVTGDKYVGGLVASNFGNVATSYSTGAVIGSEKIGGLVGYNHENVSITSSFWDKETSGQTTSDGGIGKTTPEMQTATTFLEAGWDFVDETANGTEDIWWILEGQDYPKLWWETHD